MTKALANLLIARAMNGVSCVALIAALLPGTALFAKEQVIIVGGIGGDDKYAEQFIEVTEQIRDAYLPGESTDVTQSSDGTSAEDGDSIVMINGDAVNREVIQQMIADTGAGLTSEDTFVLMLIGHGSYDGEHYKFNIPGPDITGEQLKLSLGQVNTERQLVVLATSGSGVMLKTLEASGRVLITATKSGGEINAVEFSRYWADALSNGSADYDRNEIISAQEAFRYASVQVEAHYEERNLLASEHPRMTGDNPAGLAVTRTGSLRDAANNPVVVSLLGDRKAIENDIVALKDEKDQLPQDEYFDALKVLMLRMARLQQVIDRETGWDRSDG